MGKIKLNLIKSLGLCIAGFLVFGGAAAYFLFGPDLEADDRKYAVIGIVLCVVCVIGAAATCLDHYITNIRPVKHPETRITDRQQAHRELASKRLPGKDIYDVFRRFRRRYLMQRFAIFPVCFILAELLAIFKFEEVGWDIRYAIITGVVIMIISVIIAGKKEMQFPTEETLRKAIEDSKADPVRLNADFMMASCFRTVNGAIFIGRDYFVMLYRTFCSVIDMKNIVSAELLLEDDKLNGADITFYYVRLVFASGKDYKIRMESKVKVEVFLDELELRGVVVPKAS